MEKIKLKMVKFFAEDVIDKNQIKIILITKRKIEMAEKETHHTKKIKIIFPLEKDEYGYPPFSEESMWGGEHQENYIIENIPFFVYNISLQDIVSIKKTGSRFFFDKLIHKSTNSTIRIYCKDPILVSQIRKKIIDMGCKWEFSNLKSLSAVNVPLDVCNDVISLLNKEDSLSYEISCKRF